jgi:hypothetical protein
MGNALGRFLARGGPSSVDDRLHAVYDLGNTRGDVRHYHEAVQVSEFPEDRSPLRVAIRDRLFVFVKTTSWREATSLNKR